MRAPARNRYLDSFVPGEQSVNSSSFFFSSRRRHTRLQGDWSSDVCSSDLVHRWVVGGLALIFASGLLMALAQVANFGTSVVFWTKMGLVALLIGNGYARLRTEIALRQGSLAAWSWFRRTSTASLVLWFLVLLAGTLLHATS